MGIVLHCYLGKLNIIQFQRKGENVSKVKMVVSKYPTQCYFLAAGSCVMSLTLKF